MSHLVMILLMALITFATRISFMWRPLPTEGISGNRFLEVFPTALFVALAVNGLVAPDGQVEVTPALAGLVGGAAGAVAFKRAILGVVGAGIASYWLARLIA
jgi:branched-subunit amino acid transport protein